MTYWNTLAATNDACPSGYRRANDGVIDAANTAGAVPGSQMRQSLWLNPQASHDSNIANSLFGYYADGYFDRHAIATSVNSYSNTAVHPATKDVAYVGNLFFNPTTNASLFFPAAGYRSAGNGKLDSAGDGGAYWSGSSENTVFAWYLAFTSGSSNQMMSYFRPLGLSVRCVRQ